MLPPPFQSSPHLTSTRNLTPVILDDATIVALIAKVLDRSPLSVPQIAERLGVKPESIYQYKYGRRTHPSLQWMIRLVEATGGRLWVELPDA